MLKAIILDIEGTVAPISFVKEVLFPYSKEKIKNFIEKNKNKPEIKKIIEEVKQIEGKELSDEEVINTLIRWIDEDKKIAPLKEIQGMVWKEGFEKGQLKAPLYEDAYEKIKEWKDKYDLYIYSSGSVEAQKLFFSHTNYGNIIDWFKGFFDTRIGNKKEKSSYERIVSQIGYKPDEVIFLSDNPEEIEAAEKTGLNVIKVSRPEDAQWLENYPHKQVKSFKEIKF